MQSETYKLYAVTTVYEDTDLLYHFIKHYTRLGADAVLVAVGDRQGQDSFSKAVAESVQEWGSRVRLHRFTYHEYACTNNDTARRDMFSAFGVNPSDWIMYADVDEFYDFPRPIYDTISECRRTGHKAVVGWIYDRLADSGELVKLDRDGSIEGQFPTAAYVTHKLLNANTRKIMLCRGDVRVNCAHDRCDVPTTSPFTRSGDYRAHHFRWTASLMKRARDRMAENSIGGIYRKELILLDRHLKKNGRILLTPNLKPHVAIPIRYPDVITPRKVVHWKKGTTLNMGDEITPVMLQTATHDATDGATLFACGSYLQNDWLKKVSGKRIVWGSGNNDGHRVALDASIDVRAVRGPLSANLADLPFGTPLGDPAMLLRFFRDKGKAGGMVYVPHIHQPAHAAPLGFETVRPGCQSMDEVLAVIDRISGSSFVLTSSLHGAIIAEAYGVPWGFFSNGVPMRLTPKHHDWFAYLSVDPYIAKSPEDARLWWTESGALRKRHSLRKLADSAPFNNMPFVPDDRPLVSYVTITQPGRLGLLQEAADCYAQQSIESREWVVLHDGGVAFDKDVRRICSGARVVSTSHKPLGALRNESLRHADGTYYCQWDDDDLSAPDRVQRQIEKMQQDNTLACVLDSQTYTFMNTGESRIRRTSRIEGTVVAKLAACPRYPNWTRGEDTAFLNGFKKSVSILKNAPHLYTRRFHGKNTWSEAAHRSRSRQGN